MGGLFIEIDFDGVCFDQLQIEVMKSRLYFLVVVQVGAIHMDLAGEDRDLPRMQRRGLPVGSNHESLLIRRLRIAQVVTKNRDYRLPSIQLREFPRNVAGIHGMQRKLHVGNATTAIAGSLDLLDVLDDGGQLPERGGLGRFEIL